MIAKKSMSSLVENYLTREMMPMRSDRLHPVRVVKSNSDTPLKASSKWEYIGKHTMIKQFEFRDFELRDVFLLDLLEYEREHGHRARLEVTGTSVFVQVGSKDEEMLTDLDKEYASEADLTYRDICYGYR